MRLLLLCLSSLLLSCTNTGSTNQPAPDCTPQCDGRQCGIDGCGGVCGTCGPEQTCNLAGQCVGACTPDCTARECGTDGCGGSCGECPEELTCDEDGRCFLCMPDCTGAECGDDGCGGSCGTCTSTSATCAAGVCCEPFCGTAECGGDGCGGSCGDCPQGEICGATQECELCVPDCAGLECGDDGCGGSCGDCDQGEVCDFTIGQCCTPSCDGRECGGDGCGGLCGECDQGERCNEQSGTCESCTPDCTGRECGDDGCGGTCGECNPGLTCLPSGTCYCVDTCTPSCADKDCGPDDCGGSCGTCPGGTACNYDPNRTPGWQCDTFAAASNQMSFFVSSTGSMGNGGDLGGLTGADARCQQLAEAAGVTGKTWRAYLSDQGAGIAAKDRIGAGPWFNAYGLPIVDPGCGSTCVQALHDDQIPTELIVTEMGEQLEWGIEHDIFTGSSTTGDPSGFDCSGWTTEDPGQQATVGHTDGQKGPVQDRTSWNAAHETGCDFFSLVCTLGRGHVYCFAVD